jgi:putative flippase GtrA
MSLPRRFAALICRPTYMRYGLASLGALGCDMSLFLLLLHVGVASVPASASGYIFGILVHWLISTRFVFSGGMAARGAERMRQKGLFVATALLGLTLTMATVGGGVALDLDPRLAKLAAILLSFQATYAARRAMIFRT